MDRPYTKEQVFEVEMAADTVAGLSAQFGPRPLRDMGVELLAAVIYDGMIALREAMINEEEL